MDICVRCRRPSDAGAWCKKCHPIAMREMQQRCSQGGKGMEWPTVRWSDCPEAHKPGGDEGTIPTKDAIDLLRAFSSYECRCAGTIAIWSDDPSGASSSWDMVVRAYEDRFD